jgi:hypothetical protein
LDSTVPIYPLIHHPNPPILRVVWSIKGAKAAGAGMDRRKE